MPDTRIEKSNLKKNGWLSVGDADFFKKGKTCYVGWMLNGNLTNQQIAGIFKSLSKDGLKLVVAAPLENDIKFLISQGFKKRFKKTKQLGKQEEWYL